MSLPSRVTVFEVGPRDGLQNESQPISTQHKVALVNDLAGAGLTRIEAGSFVSPKWVPQMAGSADVLRQIDRREGVQYAALTPNLQGLEGALEAGADEVAVFAAASESFSQHNINCDISQSIERFKPVVQRAKDEGVPVRGYVSCVVGCPYEGEVAIERVIDVASALIDLGCYEISLGDTIGVGTPTQFHRLLDALASALPVAQCALHCHDTYGQALANIYAGLQHGIRTIDSSVAGLGGCPYAKGASGNVATEDVLYLLAGLGIETGVELEKVVAAGQRICKALGRTNGSKVALAMSADNTH